MTTRAYGTTSDGSEFDGTTDGTDRVVPGSARANGRGNGRFHLKTVTFRTTGTITGLEIILWDAVLGARVGKIDGDSASEQVYMWEGEGIAIPLDSGGENSCEVRVITTGQDVNPCYLFIEGEWKKAD